MPFLSNCLEHPRDFPFAIFRIKLMLANIYSLSWWKAIMS